MSDEDPPIMPKEFKGSYHEYGLYLHNWYRKRHGAPPLKLVQSLNDAGDSYCLKLARNGGMLIHSTGRGYGENLYGGPQAEAWMRHVYPKSAENYMHKCAVREAVEAWYKEVKHYSYNNPGFSMHTGHFTAMVWKSSTELGIGVAWVGGTIIVAGCYKVHPNMQGQFRNNVLPYRDVDDEEELEAQRKEEEEKKRKEEEELARQEEEKRKAEEEQERQAEEEAKQDDEGVGDENSQVEDTPTGMEEAFKEVADIDGTIGWYELKDLLSSNEEFGKKVNWDKLLCLMIIRTATVQNGVSERIGLIQFENTVKGLEQLILDFARLDKDDSGFLDPFEIKDAFASGGRDVSYADVQALTGVVGEDGKMSLYGFLLSELLLTTLSVSDTGIAEDDNPAVIAWIQRLVEGVKSGKPLNELK